MKPSYIKDSLGGKLFDIFLYIFMILFSFTMLYPFYNQLVISLNEGLDAARGGLYFFPRKFTLDNYIYMFKQKNLLKGAAISVLRVLVGTSTTVFFSGLLAYVTSIKTFSGRRFMRIVFLITMYFGGGMIPTYLLIVALGLTDTFTVYWLPGLFNAYYMLLISSYMNGLPDSLVESAKIDGAGDIRIYIQIMLPLCLPVLAAVSVMAGVGHWNSWFDVLIYNSSGKWDTLQVHLRRILLDVEQVQKLMSEQQQAEEMRKLTPESIRAATTMIVTIPIIMIYPMLQKYFISGITIGAVKG